jgi:nucleoside-diphosphate-sugar epimerase
MHVLVAGAGWLGAALVRRLVARGDRVTAVRRSAERLFQLEQLGASPLLLDLSCASAVDRLPRDVDAIIACQSSRADLPDAYRSAYVEVNRTLVEAAARGAARRLVYTSSTGVFGQRDGGDVDESTPPMPASTTAEALVDAEQVVLGATDGGVHAQVVRLSGLYGPGRYGIVERVRNGALALGPGDRAWMNFCHLDDAVTFVLAALEHGRSGGMYHGSDAEPARRAEVVSWIAERLAIDPSSVSAPSGGPDRRVLSERTRAELGVALRYPSFREGLAEVAAPAG